MFAVFTTFAENCLNLFIERMDKILIVDDERLARDYMAEMVVSCIPDAKVVKPDSGENALTCLRKDSFDLLFVDIEMSGMTGLQLLEYLSKEDNKGDKMPCTFIITAFRKFEYFTWIFMYIYLP